MDLGRSQMADTNWFHRVTATSLPWLPEHAEGLAVSHVLGGRGPCHRVVAATQAGGHTCTLTESSSR